MFSPEILQSILSYLELGDLLSTSTVNKHWHQLTRLVVYSHLRVNSSTQARLLMRTLDSDTSLRITRVLELRGRRTEPARIATPSKGRGKPTRTPSSSSIKPDELVLLTSRMESLTEISLRELDFSSLRRRQVDFAAPLSCLRKISIVGRAGEGESGFNLHTCGQIIHRLPLLTHLALRNLQIHSTALSGLPTPSFLLKSLALIPNSSTPLTSEHLEWLCRSTAHAESLRELCLEWNEESPRILNEVRYTVLRVEKLSLRTRMKGVAEALVLHFPSLRHLMMNSTIAVDPERLFGNLEIPLYTLDDYSPVSGGVDVTGLANIIKQGKSEFCKKLQRIGIYDTASEELSLLREACEKRGVRLEVRTREDESGEEWIPERFAAVRLLV